MIVPRARRPATRSRFLVDRIVRWSDDPGGLPVEECARRGIEAVAGLVISEDIFRTNNYPDAHFCTCAEIYHALTGGSGYFDDHISVSFRLVEIRDGTYPLVGQESVRMVMQPLSDGKVSARWDSVDGSSVGRWLRELGSMVEDLDTRSSVCRPMTLGHMPEQEEGDSAHPSFLLLKDPGAGWQIWRRFSSAASAGEMDVEGSFREETYTMIYPILSPHMNWRFRVYDLPGGGVRWEVNSGNRK